MLLIVNKEWMKNFGDSSGKNIHRLQQN